MFCISHLLNLYGWAVIIHYIQQIYDTTVIKSGCVIAWKAIMTVEVAGLWALMWNNKSI